MEDLIDPVRRISPFMHPTFPPLLDDIQATFTELFQHERFVCMHVHIHPTDLVSLEGNLLSIGTLKQIVDPATGTLVEVIRDSSLPPGSIGVTGKGPGFSRLTYRRIPLVERDLQDTYIYASPIGTKIAIEGPTLTITDTQGNQHVFGWTGGPLT